MTIRVICKTCGAKMDIRAELAGSTRHCPKCKTEFQVPSAADNEEQPAIAAVIADGGNGSQTDLASEDSAAEKETSTADSAEAMRMPAASERTAAAAAKLSGDNDDEEDGSEDDDYVPAFVTGGSDKKTKSAASAKKIDDDDGPTLAIPKAPPPNRQRSSSFDPDAFLNDEPQPSAKRTTSASKSKPSPIASDDEFDPFADDPPASAAGSGGRDLKLPPPSKTPVSDAEVPATGGTRDRAQAARELRQALKDSALKVPTQSPSAREGFLADLKVSLGDVGPRNLAIFGGTLAFAILLYFLSSRMIGGGLDLPPLGGVTGNITLDGAPAVGATVYFQPMKSQDDSSAEEPEVKDPRTSVGVTDDKGHYRVMYLPQEGIAGATIGKCRVWVTLPPPQAAREFSQMALNVTEVKPGSQEYDITLTSVEAKQK